MELHFLRRSRVGSPTMSATVAGNQQQQHPHQEWDINDSNVPKVTILYL